MADTPIAPANWPNGLCRKKKAAMKTLACDAEMMQFTRVVPPRPVAASGSS